MGVRVGGIRRRIRRVGFLERRLLCQNLTGFKGNPHQQQHLLHHQQQHLLQHQIVHQQHLLHHQQQMNHQHLVAEKEEKKQEKHVNKRFIHLRWFQKYI